MAGEQHGYILAGRVAGAHGVKGWLKVESYTEPLEALLDYQPWLVTKSGTAPPARFEVVQGRAAGRSLVVELRGVADRDDAVALRGAEIFIAREQLPELAADEYYWADLQGLRVINSAGVELGVVDHLLETGANDVLVVRGAREHLVPFIRQQVIKKVDLQAGVIEVDWDPDF